MLQNIDFPVLTTTSFIKYFVINSPNEVSEELLFLQLGCPFRLLLINKLPSSTNINTFLLACLKEQVLQLFETMTEVLKITYIGTRC